MNIKNIGELYTVEDMPEWLESNEIEIPYFNHNKFNIIFTELENSQDVDEYEKAINNFLELKVNDRQKTNQYIYSNYKDFIECVGEEIFNFTIDSPDSVWKHIHVTEIYVSRRPYGDKKVYVQITAECDWEVEHGLQVVYKNGNELKRASDQDGHLTNSDAYDDPKLENVIYKSF